MAKQIGSRLWIGLMLAACNGGHTTSVEAEALTGSSGSANADCDLTPIDSAGTLPACAGGTPGPDGPGVPIGFTGTLESSMPLTPEDLAGIQEAAAINAARNPPSQDPIDRGFGPTSLESTGSGVLPQVGVQ